MLIVALVLAVIGLAALVTAVVTSNELVAWVCIAASVLGVILLIVDAIRERQRAGTGEPAPAADDAAADGDSIERTYQNFDAEYPDEDETPEAADVAADKPSDATDEAGAEGAETEPDSQPAKSDEPAEPAEPEEPAESAETESEPEAEHEPTAESGSESELESETRPSANG